MKAYTTNNETSQAVLQITATQVKVKVNSLELY